MKIQFLILFALFLLTVLPARAQTTDAIEPGQTNAVTQGVTANNFNAKVTKTVEKTTTKTYTVTKRKLGLVGNRPYPARTETVDGGVTVEKYVNDAKADTQVIAPDPMLDKKQETGSDGKAREYHTDDKGIEALGHIPTDVDVTDSGTFNE